MKGAPPRNISQDYYHWYCLHVSNKSKMTTQLSLHHKINTELGQVRITP